MKKLIAVLSVIFILGGLYLIDFIRAQAYDYQMVSAKPACFVLDGCSTVKMKVRLTKHGKPVKGHSIVIVASNGTLPQSRVTTDGEGIISFKYYPYLYLNDRLTPVEKVVFRFEDESNSLIFTVPAVGIFSFPVEKPEGGSVWEDWQNIGEKEGAAYDG